MLALCICLISKCCVLARTEFQETEIAHLQPSAYYNSILDNEPIVWRPRRETKEFDFEEAGAAPLKVIPAIPAA